MLIKNAYHKLACCTVFLLFIPFFASYFTQEVNWALLDYLLMGLLIFGFGSIFVYLSKKLPKHRLVIGIAVFILFLYIWAEFAVGIFTSLGS